MKKSNLVVLMLSFCAAGLAHADGGRIEFRGAITEPTCGLEQQPSIGRGLLAHCNDGGKAYTRTSDIDSIAGGRDLPGPMRLSVAAVADPQKPRILGYVVTASYK